MVKQWLKNFKINIEFLQRDYKIGITVGQGLILLQFAARIAGIILEKSNNGKMNLSNVGVLANVFWYEIKNHAQNVELGEYIIMPNHVHGILILNGDANAVGVGHAGSVDAGFYFFRIIVSRTPVLFSLEIPIRRSSLLD